MTVTICDGFVTNAPGTHQLGITRARCLIQKLSDIDRALLIEVGRHEVDLFYQIVGFVADVKVEPPVVVMGV